MAFNLRAGFLVAVNRAAVQRSGASGGLRERAVKLELQNVREEVAHVRNIGGDVILRGRIEIRFAAIDRRRDSLIFLAQLPPGLVVLFRRNLAGEDLPAPLIDHQAERQKRDLFERLVQQQADILRRIRRLDRAARSSPGTRE